MDLKCYKISSLFKVKIIFYFFCHITNWLTIRNTHSHLYLNRNTAQNCLSIFAVKSVIQGQQAALILGFAHPHSHSLASEDVHYVPLRAKKASGKMGFQECVSGKKPHPTTSLQHRRRLLTGFQLDTAMHPLPSGTQVLQHSLAIPLPALWHSPSTTTRSALLLI